MPKNPVRRVYGKPWSQMADIPLTKENLQEMGKCLVKHIVREAKRDFGLRGWSPKAPKALGGTKDLFHSFSYRIVGERTVEVLSTFPGIRELLEGIPKRRMVWLTQEAKDKHPERYELSPREERLKMNRAGRVKRHQRLPLVVPLKARGGEVVFRMAPLTMSDAWIHPGIAKFTFMQRAIKKGRESCIEVVAKAATEYLQSGDPTR